MKVIVKERCHSLRERLRDRLDQAAALRCAEHDQAPLSVTIDGQESGWFDSVWSTCCEKLERRAVEIVKHRC